MDRRSPEIALLGISEQCLLGINPVTFLSCFCYWPICFRNFFPAWTFSSDLNQSPHFLCSHYPCFCPHSSANVMPFSQASVWSYPSEPSLCYSFSLKPPHTMGALLDLCLLWITLADKIYHCLFWFLTKYSFFKLSYNLFTSECPSQSCHVMVFVFNFQRPVEGLLWWSSG